MGVGLRSKKLYFAGAKMKKKILVVGASGQLGSAVMQVQDSFHLMGMRHAQFDLLDTPLMRKVLEQELPDLIINCAAYTNVEQAEEDEEAAFLLNARGVHELSKLCGEFSVPMIHLSTDYVFDGTKHEAYLEIDPTSPLNVYGKSKLRGEELALEENDEVYVIRVSWLYAEGFNNFKNTILQLSTKLDELKVVDDQIAAPTFAGQLAEDLLRIAKVILEQKPPGGVYHYSHDGNASWFDFAQSIKKFYQFETPVTPVDSAHFESKAKRPSFSKLNNSKLKETFDLSSIYWEEALQKCFEQENQAKK